MVRFASLFNFKEQTVTFISGTTYSLEALCSMGMGDLLGAMFDFSEKLYSLDLSPEELGLFTAVVLVSAGEWTVVNNNGESRTDVWNILIALLVSDIVCNCQTTQKR